MLTKTWIRWLASAALLASCAAAQEAPLYVSTVGNDAWSGKVLQPNAACTGGPYATLTKARDALRTQGTPHGPATVRVRGGTYQYCTSALDAKADIYLTGATLSSGFPIVSAAQQQPGGGNSDAFVAKIGFGGAGTFSAERFRRRSVAQRQQKMPWISPSERRRLHNSRNRH